MAREEPLDPKRPNLTMSVFGCLYVLPQALRTLAKAIDPAWPVPRQAALRTLHHPATQEPLDRALVLAFVGPHSFTGEDVAELHVHGGPAVVADVLEALAALPGLRLAAPGEFTRRAFENGKLDLTQVEALADLVNAETPWQRRQALRHMEGAARDLLERWRNRLKRLLAHVEAANDFAETDELDEGTRDDWAASVRGLLEEIRAHLASRRGEVIRHGIQVAIMGVPNAGKSSLLNRLGM